MNDQATVYQHDTVRPSWLWDSYQGIDPQTTASMFTKAAELIAHDGHNAYGDDKYDTATLPGLSMGGALRAVARAELDKQEFGYQRGWEVDELVDELENRLAAVLYLLGQVRGKPMNDMGGVPFSWESNPASWYPRPAYHDTADVVRVLRLAAGMVELVITTWPATA